MITTDNTRPIKIINIAALGNSGVGSGPTDT